MGAIQVRVQRFKLREGRMHSGDSNVFSKAESVQVLDGNILRDKQRVICSQKAYTVLCQGG